MTIHYKILGCALVGVMAGGTAPSLRAQSRDPEPDSKPRSVLLFRSTSETKEFSQLQVNLKQVVTALPVENTTLPAEVLGSVAVTGANGNEDIRDYVWTTTPTSRLYLGRSGYKSLKVRYQYGNSRQTLPYTLDIACQTVGLKSQARTATATCNLFGNGPLLTGEVKAKGQLTIDETTAADTTNSPLAETPVVKASLSGTAYLGKGALVMYPTTAKDTEQRYGLTQMILETNNQRAKLTVVSADPTPKTTVFQGTLEPGDRGRILTVTAMDGKPGQGKIFVGNNGTFRTVAPIFVGDQTQELSLYFRASEP